jgi:hypothetical protein
MPTEIGKKITKNINKYWRWNYESWRFYNA